MRRRADDDRGAILDDVVDIMNLSSLCLAIVRQPIGRRPDVDDEMRAF
jgi:hypothetical protein